MFKSGWHFGALRYLILPIRVLLMAVTMLVGAVPLYAQQTASNTNLPDAPSQVSGAAENASNFESGIDVVDVIFTKSLFFPNLAATKFPLRTEEKFKLFMRNSVSGSALLGALTGAGFSQARDSPHGYGQGGEGYAKRFGSGMARNASSQFFGTFVLASAFHQDPRFFVRSDSSFKAAVEHSVRRVFITRSDSGQEVTNWSGLLGPLLAEGLANAYMPPDAQTAGKTFERYGTDIGVHAATNVLRQYWPTILRAVHINRRGAIQAESTSASPAAAP